MTPSTVDVAVRVEQMLLRGWDDLPMADKERLCAVPRLDAAAVAVVERFAVPRLEAPCTAAVCERSPGMVGWLLDESGRMAVIEVAAGYAIEWGTASTAHRRRLLRNALGTAYVTSRRVQECLSSDARHPFVGDGLGARWAKVAIPLWRQSRQAAGYDAATVETLLALLTALDLTPRMQHR